MRTRFVILFVALLLPGCGSSDETLDAGEMPDATLACDPGNPGVRVHVTAGFGAEVSCPYWSTGEDAMAMRTNGGALMQRYAFYGDQLDAARQATVVLRYPAGTQAGPASVGFYSIVGLYNWDGLSEFTADPQACVDVDLALTCVAVGGGEVRAPGAR
jgi:hypothetical protein